MKYFSEIFFIYILHFEAIILGCEIESYWIRRCCIQTLKKQNFRFRENFS